MSKVEIHVDRSTFEAGETIIGEVVWQASKEVKEILLELEWFTEGKGTTDGETVASQTIPSESESGRQRFSIDIPKQVPASYQGEIVSVCWQLTASGEIAWAKDPESHFRLVIGPRGQAYEIYPSRKTA
ncbi:MAG: hypothetical protein AB8B48_09200 [Pseudomonadales bacterium]